MRGSGGQTGWSHTDAASAAIRVIISHLWIIIVARVWEVSSSPIGGAVWPAPTPPDVSGRHHVTPPCRYLPTYSVVHKTLSWADLLICAAIFQIYRKENSDFPMSVASMIKSDRIWQKTGAAMKVNLALKAELNWNRRRCPEDILSIQYQTEDLVCWTIVVEISRECKMLVIF